MKHCILDKRVAGVILDAEGTMSVTCVGTSMAPAIMNRQSVEVGKVTAFRPGCCYLFRYNGELVVHRLVARRASIVFFLGDNSRTIEPVITDAVLGEVADAHSPLFRAAMALMNYFFHVPFAPRRTIPGSLQRIRRAGIRVLLSMDSAVQRYRAGISASIRQPGGLQ